MEKIKQAIFEVSKVSNTKIFILSLLLTASLFIFQRNKGLTMADEGFLWYGAQRVMVGEVPIRDFSAYDPGRYYWAAGLMLLQKSNGVISLRAAVAVFQLFGLFAALLLIFQKGTNRNWLLVLLSAIILLAWMLPYYRIFDISLSIFLIAILSLLIQRPSQKNYFLTGVVIGLVACFGRNHGIYGVIGSIGVMLWLQIKPVLGTSFFKGLLLWGSGIFVGFLPVLVMICLVPGFAVSFWRSIQFLFEIHATNIPLSIPWPWRINFLTLSREESLRGVFVGLFFLAVLGFGVFSLAWVIYRQFCRRGVTPTLAACSFLALPYAHYAYSRADVEHLALGIFPLLIGALTFFARSTFVLVRWFGILLLCELSLWTTSIYFPCWQYWRYRDQFISIEIGKDKIFMEPSQARPIILLKQLEKKYLEKGGSFLALPFLTTAYSIIGCKAPAWDIYPLFYRPPQFEQKEIERAIAANPQFIILIDLPLDGREDLRFKNTHPFFFRYIQEHFEITSESAEPYLIFKSKNIPASN